MKAPMPAADAKNLDCPFKVAVVNNVPTPVKCSAESCIMWEWVGVDKTNGRCAK